MKTIWFSSGKMSAKGRLYLQLLRLLLRGAAGIKAVRSTSSRAYDQFYSTHKGCWLYRLRQVPSGLSGQCFGAGGGNGAKKKKALLNPDICLGCGMCVRSCPADSMELLPRAERVITPVNSAHRIVLMAIERGTLQHLVFDNQAHLNHRAMAAILGVILKLPPVKQLMASRQMKSRYLENLLARQTI